MLQEFQKKLLEYQKAGDQERLSVLRYLLSKLKNKEIELRAEGEQISREDIVKIINKQIKQREESVEIYEEAGREDLRSKEHTEKIILEELLNFAQSLQS